MKKTLKIVLGSLAALLLVFAVGGTLLRLKSHKSKRVRAQVVPVTEETSGATTSTPITMTEIMIPMIDFFMIDIVSQQLLYTDTN